MRNVALSENISERYCLKSCTGFLEFKWSNLGGGTSLRSSFLNYGLSTDKLFYRGSRFKGGSVIYPLFIWNSEQNPDARYIYKVSMMCISVLVCLTLKKVERGYLWGNQYCIP